ncbi:hypothetical protein LSH36_696g01086 [Paralvinella palmiformis]|uniref:Ashwin n=1 Tax=Paralvinella palmiformis TaxID=53620 RepID=A0AAD9J3Y4_9ANNE|nr:hypothetical protein LSH36_696g01086 [Paralvinella palmiformis]
MEKEERENFDLFQPEILPKETLINLLNQRCPSLGELSGFDNNALVELFYKNIAPHPQRKYRANRRGQRMTKNQTMREKRKRTHDQITGSSDQSSSSPISQPYSGLINSFNLKTASDRLKPPPTAINFDRKIVKLGKSSTATNHHSVTRESASTKIKLSSPTTPTDEPAVLSKVMGKSPASSLLNVVINVRHQNGSSNTEKVDIPAGSSGGITKILPEKKTASCSKIKLKRTSNISTETAMDISTKMENLNNRTVDSDTSSLIINTNISLSNKTKNEDSKMTPEEKQKDSPTDGMQKKFKRVAITWP